MTSIKSSLYLYIEDKLFERQNGIFHLECGMDGQKITYIDIRNLLLDLDSPRLPEDIAETDQKKAFEHIIEQYAINELVQAIGENGYFAGEPLIVIPDPEGSGKYTVVEGNRRLSALMLLDDPDLAQKYYLKNLAEKAKNAKSKPKEIPCVKFTDRTQALRYLGLRHISGVKSWDLIAKARYIRKLFDETDHSLDIDERVKNVTRSIGTEPNYIRRILLTSYIYNIVKTRGFFELNGVNENSFQFYMFYSAISKFDIRHFIGIPEQFQLDFENEINMDNLKLIVKLTCERNEEGYMVINNSSQLDDLINIISEPKALEKLKQTNSIKKALKVLNLSIKEFVDSLYSAKSYLGNAQSNIQEVNEITNPREITEIIDIIEHRIRVIKRSKVIREVFQQTKSPIKKFKINLESAKDYLGYAQNDIQEVNSIDQSKELQDMTLVIEKRTNYIKNELKSNREINCK